MAAMATKEEVVQAVRAMGSNARDLRDAAHEAHHALMRWLLGDDTALDTMPDARAAALRAGWKGPRRAKTPAETLAPASDDTDDGDDAQAAE